MSGSPRASPSRRLVVSRAFGNAASIRNRGERALHEDREPQGAENDTLHRFRSAFEEVDAGTASSVVESRPGRGSTFEIRLPIAGAVEGQAPLVAA